MAVALGLAPQLLVRVPLVVVVGPAGATLRPRKDGVDARRLAGRQRVLHVGRDGGLVEVVPAPALRERGVLPDAAGVEVARRDLRVLHVWRDGGLAVVVPAPALRASEVSFRMPQAW